MVQLSGQATETRGRLLLREAEVCQQLALGRSSVRQLMASGDLPFLKIGKSLRFRAEDIENYVRRLASERDGAAGAA